MTEDQLPLSIADMAQAPEHTETGSSRKVDRPAPRREESPPPSPEATAETDDNWQQSGFGSFP